MTSFYEILWVCNIMQPDSGPFMLVDWTLWSVLRITAMQRSPFFRATLRAGHSKWSQCRRWGSCSSLDWRMNFAVRWSGYDQDMIRMWSGCLNSQGPGFTSMVVTCCYLQSLAKFQKSVNMTCKSKGPKLPWACRIFMDIRMGPQTAVIIRLAGISVYKKLQSHTITVSWHKLTVWPCIYTSFRQIKHICIRH